MGIDDVLAASRAGVQRLTPEETQAAVARGALLVDTRTDVQRREQGELPGALVIDRTVLEWRLDPASRWRIPEVTGYDVEVVVVCGEGYSSSLAAASLRTVGLHRATGLRRRSGRVGAGGPASGARRSRRPSLTSVRSQHGPGSSAAFCTDALGVSQPFAALAREVPASTPRAAP